MTGYQIRYLAPVVLVTICLVALCAFTAASLLGEQQVLTEALQENVESWRAAVELKQCLIDLIALENERVEKVSVLRERVTFLLGATRAVADQPEEKRLLAQIEAGYDVYLCRWRALPPLGQPGHEEARREATRVLEKDVLKSCQELKLYNASRIEESAAHHEWVLRRLAWGLTAVGALGAVAGAVLGYGVASGLARSIRRLRVQIRDAVGKIDRDRTEIVLTGQGDFTGLHADLDRLTERIEGIIGDLRQREREVVRAEQLAAVGQLAAGVAHEIRNPLTSIKMLVQAGLEDAGGLGSDDLRVMEGEVRRMEQSLRTFLDFARPPKPRRRRVALPPLLEGVLGLVRGRADKQRVSIEEEFAPGGQTAAVDPEQLRQVLVNLCLNALDAMPTGGTLGVSLRGTPGGGVEIEIRDTGPGFSDPVLAQLFQPFFSTKDGGLGLGLVISGRIMEDHGGRIVAGNRPEGGARLLVSIPAGPVGAQEEASHADAAGG